MQEHVDCVCMPCLLYSVLACILMHSCWVTVSITQCLHPVWTPRLPRIKGGQSATHGTKRLPLTSRDVPPPPCRSLCAGVVYMRHTCPQPPCLPSWTHCALPVRVVAYVRVAASHTGCCFVRDWSGGPPRIGRLQPGVQRPL